MSARIAVLRCSRWITFETVLGVISYPASASASRISYGLFRDGLWIYVGKSGDIRARLLEHLAETGTLIKQYGPTHFVAMKTNNDEAQEKALIAELRPVANQRLG